MRVRELAPMLVLVLCSTPSGLPRICGCPHRREQCNSSCEDEDIQYSTVQYGVLRNALQSHTQASYGYSTQPEIRIQGRVSTVNCLQ